MFGYIIANKDAMPEDEFKRYRAAYCGLCRALLSRHGRSGQMTLNYDMTFLILLLSSMYEPDEECGMTRCIAHPSTMHEYFQNEFTDYAADMNVALAYLNCLDDWKDDRDIAALASANKLKKAYLSVCEKYPRQCGTMNERIAKLSELEKNKVYDPDAASDCFGELMGELFAVREDPWWTEKLRRLGYSLGKFIYILDACVDYQKDVKAGKYNPLVSLEANSVEELRPTLTLLIGACADEFEKLPLVQDVGILRNILYSGVWTKFEAAAVKEYKNAKGKEAQAYGE